MALHVFEWMIWLLHPLNYRKIIDFLKVLGKGRSLTGLLELDIRRQMLQRFLKLYCLFVYFVGIYKLKNFLTTSKSTWNKEK